MPPIIGFQRERHAKIKDGGCIEKENYNGLCRSAVSHSSRADTVPTYFKLCQPEMLYRSCYDMKVYFSSQTENGSYGTKANRMQQLSDKVKTKLKAKKHTYCAFGLPQYVVDFF